MGIFYKTREDLFSFLEENARVFFHYVLALIIFLLLSRFLEYFYIAATHRLSPNALSLMLSGIPYDFLWVMGIVCYGFIPFLALAYFKPGAAKIFLLLILVLFLLGNFLLIFYYAKSLVPLGSDIFGYTTEEITHTIHASGGLSLGMIFLLVTAVILFVFLFKLIVRLSLPKMVLFVLLLIMLLSFFMNGMFVPKEEMYKTDLEYYTVVNKLQYFSEKVSAYLGKQDTEELLSEDYFIDDPKSAKQLFTYVSADYPFLHTYEPVDVLGKYFQVGTKLPNIVFIITESLGRSYSGEGAEDGSFTPFLDSLAQQSLYWKNFLSTTGRTFGVFSSLFASLPFAEKGFLELGDNMPPHFSLIRYLKQLGYYTSFYHGGDIHFDNMDIFFKKEGTDFILGDKNFGGAFQKMPANTLGFSWGYGDKELFKRSLELIEQRGDVPRLDIYMTQSMHDPFLVQAQPYYRAKVREFLRAMPEHSTEASEYEKDIDKYATVMYTDDAFKHFFELYRTRDDYKNTIFIITGDHRMPEIAIRTKLERFHVPFLIYSPMLKSTALFSSISTHFDVLPSLLAFLNKNYNTSVPKYVPWMSTGIDSAIFFRNTHSVPLMRNKNELLDYLQGGYFLADEELFKVYDNLILSRVNDNNAERKIRAAFNDFRGRNREMMKKNALEPDSVLKFRAAIMKKKTN